MAEIIKNDKGFKVIKMTNTEAERCKFGFDLPDRHIVLDDHTNREITGDIYYVCVLNHTLSEKSYKDWYEGAKNYPEDKPFEKRYFKYYSKILNLNDGE